MGCDGVVVVVAHEILETAQSPNILFPLGLGLWTLDLELGLGLVNLKLSTQQDCQALV